MGSPPPAPPHQGWARGKGIGLSPGKLARASRPLVARLRRRPSRSPSSPSGAAPASVPVASAGSACLPPRQPSRPPFPVAASPQTAGNLSGKAGVKEAPPWTLAI